MDHQAELYDPLLRGVALPLTATFYALGFRVDIATNSQTVLDAAAESWGLYRQEFDSRPVQLHFIVLPEGDPASEPVVRAQRHSFSIVSDRHNFGAYDAATFFGYCYLSRKTVAHHAWFRFHFLETIAYMLLAQQYAMPVHAACVARGDSGILLYGRSGAGKSTLAWACARSGWTFVTDDGAWLLPQAEDRTVLGRYAQIRFKPDAPRLFPELAAYASRLAPHGKPSLEIPLADFPSIRTASRCRVEHVVVLDREPGAPARTEPLPPSQVASQLLADMPWYGEEVHARYRSVVGRLLRAPCHRLIYDRLDDAVHALAVLT